MYCICAVSYTHLDVYKRQDQCYELQVDDGQKSYADILLHLEVAKQGWRWSGNVGSRVEHRQT